MSAAKRSISYIDADAGDNECRDFMLARFTPEPNSGCWLWDGDVREDGYAMVYFRGAGQWLAHRLAYILFRGPIIDDLFVCHTCDVRSCVNPDHLFLGTHEDNMADMVRKGRQWRSLPGKVCRKGHQKHHYGGKWSCPICHSESAKRNRRIARRQCAEQATKRAKYEAVCAAWGVEP